jgi:uncharacterized membrane protein (GlpM family)
MSMKALKKATKGQMMKWLITKYLITAAVVVLVSEAAKRSDRFGGFIAAFPMITLLTLVWLHIENQPTPSLLITLGTRSGMLCQLFRCS